MSRELTLQDVRKKFSGYRYQDMATSDAHTLCKNFKSLKPQDQKQFVHSNGQSENCVSLAGTIPVSIKGQTYNIPVCIWLRRQHPYTSPIVYVTPTPTMGIQQSRYVDNNGLVYLPYISEWKQVSSDLSTLAQVMCATFAESCPVYSRRPQQQQQPATYYPQQPQPPYPQQHQRPYGQPQPPYPARGGMPMPTPYHPPPTSGPQGYYPVASRAPAPYPTSSSPGYTPQPQPSRSYPSQPPSSTPPSYYQQHSTSSITTSASAGSAAMTTAISAEAERKQIEEQERIKRRSLESAVEDRVRRQVKQVVDSAQDEMETMLQTQEDLKEGSIKINTILQEMENKKHEVESSIDLLKSKNAELESMLDYLRAQPEKIDVDEAVSATTPLYNQILQLYAEENALDDTIYYLGEALRKGVIELEIFLKYVRELSRQQFMARATIMKGRSTAGLPDYGTV